MNRANSMKYKSVIVTERGGPEVLQVVEKELHPLEPDDARVKVAACLVCGPDVTARYGDSPFLPKPPFTPGYAIVGDVEAVGRGVTNVAVGNRVAALTAYGGYTEQLYWKADRLIPVPSHLDPVEVAPLILNYIVAYHGIHRWAKAEAGDKALIIGASGGVGTALLQLGQLAGLNMYGIASRSKHHVLEKYGAVPIDYHSQDFVAVIREREPDGLDVVFDGMAGEYFKRGYSLLKRGGVLVGYGNPNSYRGMFQLFGRVLLYNLLPEGKSAKLYSTGISHLRWDMFLNDWAELFRLLEEGKIKPIIEATFPLLEARQANELLESGQVIGNIVLQTPDS
jgi:NADPH:quinone reductase-like Zn-dependent oxidoreductase